MPYYRDIAAGTKGGKRTAQKLLALREALDKEIPARTLNETLLLATWNIRELDSSKYGSRLDESIRYLAEIIDRFDLVAVQEVRRDLAGLKRVMRALGGHWKCLFTDTTLGAQGNNERMAYLYDSRKVRFGGLSGELVLPSQRQADGTYAPVQQFWRTPYVCGFEAGWAKFMLATVHILWGGDGADPVARVQEIRDVAQTLKARTEDPTSWARNLIVLGDFNIFDTSDKTFKQLEDAGFTIPEQLQAITSNAAGGRHYDQIAFREQQGRLGFTGQAGVFDFFKVLFADDEQKTYRSAMMPAYETTGKGKARTTAGKSRYYKAWRTFQMSDHFPMWAELRIDYSEDYLCRKLSGDA